MTFKVSYDTINTMHVLVIPSWYPADFKDPGGSFFREQSEALVEAGMQVGVLAPNPVRWYTKDLQGYKKPKASIENGVKVVRFDLIKAVPRFRVINTICAMPTMNRLMKAYVDKWGRPDVIHAHSLYPAAFLAAEVSRNWKIPFILTEHRCLDHMIMHSPLGRAVEQKVVSKAASRHGVSLGHVEMLQERFGKAGGQWSYVPNMLPQVSENLSAIKREDDRLFVVGHVSMLNSVKRADLLVEAFERAFADDPTARLKIVGDGSTLPMVKSLAQQGKTADRIGFTGRLTRQEVADFCAGLDVFVMASDNEPFGVVFIEALAEGTPVIATRTWGGETIVQEGDGILIPIGDLEALVNGLKTLRTKPSTLKERQLRRERCIARFGKQSFVARYRDIYERAIENNGFAGLDS